MRHVSQTVRKGALSATTALIVVSVLMSLLSMGAGMDMVLKPFIDLAGGSTSDEGWIEDKIKGSIARASEGCQQDQQDIEVDGPTVEDQVIPQDGNFSRDLSPVEELEKERFINNDGSAGSGGGIPRAEIRLKFLDDGDERFRSVLAKGINDGYSHTAVEFPCKVGLNGTTDLDQDKKTYFRIFAGSYAQSDKNFTIQVLQG
jgi:hypothetical protein